MLFRVLLNSSDLRLIHDNLIFACNRLHIFTHLSLLPANMLEIAGLFFLQFKYIFFECHIVTVE